MKKRGIETKIYWPEDHPTAIVLHHDFSVSDGPRLPRLPETSASKVNLELREGDFLDFKEVRATRVLDWGDTSIEFVGHLGDTAYLFNLPRFLKDFEMIELAAASVVLTKLGNISEQFGLASKDIANMLAVCGYSIYSPKPGWYKWEGINNDGMGKAYTDLMAFCKLKFGNRSEFLASMVWSSLVFLIADKGGPCEFGDYLCAFGNIKEVLKKK
jgi:hypothetical protein